MCCVTILDIGICSARVFDVVLSKWYIPSAWNFVASKSGGEAQSCVLSGYCLTCWIGGAWFLSRGGTCGVCVTACLLVKPAVSHLVKELLAFSGARRFITVFTTAGHLPPSCARCNQTVVSHFRRARKICDKRLLASPCVLFWPPALDSSAPAGWIFMKFGIWEFLENMCRKF
jgi:hypothetical protein